MKFTFDTDILAALNELSDAQAGRLFKMIYEYCRGNKNVDSFYERKGDTMMRIIFAPIRAAIDREEERAREIGRKRAQAGAKGGRQANLSKCKQMVANDSKCKQMVANEAIAKNDDFTSLINIDDNNNINNNLSLSYKEKFVEATLSDCWRELRNDEGWREVVTINTRSAGHDWFTLEQFDTYLDNFFRELENRDEKMKTPSDAKAHFASWLKIELSKESKQYVTTPTNKQPRAKGSTRNTPAASATSIESVKL